MAAGSGGDKGDLAWEVNQMAIRLEILAGRMAGCNEQAVEEGRPPTHELIDEANDFAVDAKATAAAVGAALRLLDRCQTRSSN